MCGRKSWEWVSLNSSAFKFIFSKSTPSMYLVADQKFEDPETECKFSYFWLCPPPFSLPMSCVFLGLLLGPWKGQGQGDLGANGYQRNKMRSLLLMSLSSKLFAVWGKLPVLSSCLMPAPYYPADSVNPPLEIFFGWPADWGWRRESDTWSLRCQMHQSNLFRHIFIWVFSVLSNSVSFSEDICLSWIKSLNGLIKST